MQGSMSWPHSLTELENLFSLLVAVAEAKKTTDINP